jgi:hypothetical protein
MTWDEAMKRAYRLCRLRGERYVVRGHPDIAWGAGWCWHAMHVGGVTDQTFREERERGWV